MSCVVKFAEKLATAMFSSNVSVTHPYILCNSTTSARVENHSFWLMRRIFDASFSHNTELFRKVLMLILRPTWSVGRLAMSFQTKQVGSSSSKKDSASRGLNCS